MLVGDPGIGKSRLLDAASDFARAGGVRVLSTTGIGSETNLPYAALYSLLRPVLGGVGRLPIRQRQVLLGAGMAEAESNDLFLVALAALELFTDTVTPSGLLVTVDDLHLIDQASKDVLGFVARRIDAEPLMILTVVRLGYPRPPGLDANQIVVGPLADHEAVLLVKQRAPELALTLRRAVLDVAEGNPLALLELPTVLASAPRGWREPLLPPSERLERAFADRFTGLSEACRLLLLAAVVSDSGDVDQTISTAMQMTDHPVGVDELEPAFAAGLLRLDGSALRFRHPLVRLAVYQAADPVTRRSAHAALAAALRGEPDRRAWHLAQAAAGKDEEVAKALDMTAERARRRGAPAAALNAIRRAAELSADPVGRVDRLLAATELAVEIGERDTVAELLDQLERSLLTPVQGAHLAWIRELREDGIELRPDVVYRLVRLARTCRHDGAVDLALKILHAAALRCWWGTGDADAADEIASAADDLGVDQELSSMRPHLCGGPTGSAGP